MPNIDTLIEELEANQRDLEALAAVIASNKFANYTSAFRKCFKIRMWMLNRATQALETRIVALLDAEPLNYQLI